MQQAAVAVKSAAKTGFYYARVEIAVLRDPSLTPSDKAVYGVICSHADVKSRTAVLSVETIANETNCGKRTAQASIKKLATRGLLEREERFEGGRQIACLYRVGSSEQKRSQRGADTAGDAGNCTLGDVEFCTPGGAESAHKPEPVVNENQKNNPTPLTPQKTEAGGSESPEMQKADHDTAGQEQGSGLNPAFFQSILDAYNRILPELRQVSGLSPSHVREIEARIREDPARTDPAWWERYFRSIRDYPCPMGKSGSGWRADFDWLIGERGMGTVLGGKFKTASASGTKGGSEGGWERQRQFTNGEGEVDARALLREG